MKKMNLLLILLLYINTTLLSQSTSSISTEPKTISYGSGEREVFTICTGQPVKTFRDTLEYYWYNEQSGIKSTKGGAGGQLLHGKYQYFNDKGNLIKEANYYLGLEHGLYRTWDELGNIKETFKYSYGTYTYLKFLIDGGYWTEWTGQMFSKGSIKIVYKPNGAIVEKTVYVDNFKGNLKAYSEETGKLILDCTRGGTGTFYYGPYRSFYNDGKPKVVGQFVDKLRDGNWLYYNEDGSIKYTVKYTIQTDYFENKKIRAKGSKLMHSSEWLKDGMWTYYDEEGHINKIEEYEAGELKEPK